MSVSTGCIVEKFIFVKELEIKSVNRDCSGNRTHNHLIGNHTVWVRAPLRSLKFRISHPVSRKKLFESQATAECGFILTVYVT